MTDASRIQTTPASVATCSSTLPPKWRNGGLTLVDRRHGPCPVAALHASTLEYVSAPQTIDTGAPPVSYLLPVKSRPDWRAGSGTTISGTPSCVVIMLPSKVVSTFVVPSLTT